MNPAVTRAYSLPPSIIFQTIDTNVLDECVASVSRGFVTDASSAHRCITGTFDSVIFGNSGTSANTTVWVVDFKEGVEKSDDPVALFELRRLSGLSWEQVADVLGVDRRSVHNWAAGKPIALKNRQRIGATLAVLRFINRGDAASNRDLILGPALEGKTFLQLLAAHELIAVRTLAGQGIGEASAFSPPIETISWGPEHFGETAARALSVPDHEVKILSKPNYRRSKARRK